MLYFLISVNASVYYVDQPPHHACGDSPYFEAHFIEKWMGPDLPPWGTLPSATGLSVRRRQFEAALSLRALR